MWLSKVERLTLNMENGWQWEQLTPGGHPLDVHFLLQTMKGRAWTPPCPLTEEQRHCLCCSLTFPQLSGFWPGNRQQRTFTDYLPDSLLGSDPGRECRGPVFCTCPISFLVHKPQTSQQSLVHQDVFSLSVRVAMRIWVWVESVFLHFRSDEPRWQGKPGWVGLTTQREKADRTVVPSAGPQWIAHEEDKAVVDHVINII